MIYMKNCESMIEGDSYIVWYDFEFNGDNGLFILHMQGDKKLLPMVRYLRSLNKTIYFCEGFKDVWRNHRELVGKFTDTKQDIFKFVWGPKDDKLFN